MRKVFVDLDGVLCDFIGGFQKKFGVSFFDVSEEEAWKLVKAQPNLWAELDPFPTALAFFDDVNHLTYKYHKSYPVILTAVPKSSFVESAKNKRVWVRNWLGAHVHVIPVIGGQNKAGYVDTPGDILIDDMFDKNLKPWVKAGGVAVHHIEGTDHYETTWTKFRGEL